MAVDLAVPSTSPLVVVSLDSGGHLYRTTRSVPPVVEFTAPASGETVTDTTRPTIGWWTTPLDHDPVQTVHVRLFSAAQVAETGFDPKTSTPLWGVDVEPGTLGGDLDIDLPDGTYTLAGWSTVAATGDTDAATSTFTMDVTRPDAPTVAATPGARSITVAVADGVSGSEAVIEVSDDGGATWAPLATVTFDSSGDATIEDQTASFATERSWRARTVTTDPYLASLPSTAATATLTPASDEVATLGDPARQIVLDVTVITWDTNDHLAAGVFYPLGATRAVVITDTPTGLEGKLGVFLATADEQAAFRDLLATGNRLLYRDASGRTVWLRRTDKAEWTWPVTITGDTAYAQVSFPFVEVA
jgi:hypothetical protein